MKVKRVGKKNSYQCESGRGIIDHEFGSIYKITEIVKELQPELIIELGTGYGGMTLLFYDMCPNAEIHTFDNKKMYSSRINRVNYYNQNIIKHNNTIINLCSDKRHKLLYCDNGNKIFEVNNYGCYLDIGDVLGVHDWESEIFYSDVKNLLDGWFDPVEENEWFEENNFSSRFFRRHTGKLKKVVKNK